MDTPEDPSGGEVIVHPLVDVCLARLQPGPSGGEPYLLERASLQPMEAVLEKLPAADLAVAVRELLYFAHHLDTRLQSPTAARTLLELLGSQAPRLAGLEGSAGDVARELDDATARAKAEAFLGIASDHAPATESKPGEGSFKAGPGAQIQAERVPNPKD